MKRMGRDCPFVYDHPLRKLHGNKNRLNNIGGWLALFLIFFLISTITSIAVYSVLLRPNLMAQEKSNISKHQQGWKSIHHPTAQHGLAVRYNGLKVAIDTVNIPDQTFTSHIELISVLTPIKGEQIFWSLTTCSKPARNKAFIEELTAQLQQLHEDEYNAIFLGDLNLDQMLDP